MGGPTQKGERREAKRARKTARWKSAVVEVASLGREMTLEIYILYSLAQSLECYNHLAFGCLLYDSDIFHRFLINQMDLHQSFFPFL